MFIPRIYLPQPIELNQTIQPDEKTSHYLLTVIRLAEGDNVLLFNGEGGEYHAKVCVSKKKIFFTIQTWQDVNRQSPINIHLGQALVRGDRMDLVIQKSTELGVNSITPLLSQRCSVKLDEARSQKRLSHWQQIAISAAEQSGRTDVPLIQPPLSLTEWVNQSFTGTSIVFDIGDYPSLRQLELSSSFRVAVGPESGWEPHETSLMTQSGFTACQLGPRILRTETAGISAVALLQGIFGDL